VTPEPPPSTKQYPHNISTIQSLHVLKIEMVNANRRLICKRHLVVQLIVVL